MTRQRSLRLAVGGAVLAALGFLVAASGVMPIKASSGHWPITEWFLKFAMRQSVWTHSLGIEPPPLDDPALLVAGAGHYESGCRPCHGSPSGRDPRIPGAMTPHPPDLSERASTYDRRELFYVVKHGVKMTGMPAWPALAREDEVWALVAFLEVLPSLDAAEYERLARGEPHPALDGLGGVGGRLERVLVESCGRCHGVDGNGRGEGAFPRLAGQSQEYLLGALRAYARGERASGIMGPIAAGLRDETLVELARHYARRTPASSVRLEELVEEDRLRHLGALPPEVSHAVGAHDPPREPIDRAWLDRAIERGRQIALDGIPERDIPSCADCHGPRGRPTHARYPVLAGQPPRYLVNQLELFEAEIRDGGPWAELMHEVTRRMEPAQMHEVALYYASLAPPAVAAHARTEPDLPLPPGREQPSR